MKNIAHILENCPKGTKLYSPLCGECTFDNVSFGTIICKRRNGQEITFTSEGCHMIPIYDDCECLLFPSKENRDWDKFNPFKDGDIIYVKSNDDYGTVLISIYKGEDSLLFYDYCSVSLDRGYFYIGSIYGLIHTNKIGVIRFAAEEEKEKLFKAIKDNGYKWNPETKTLEKLIELKFKVGDEIVRRNSVRFPGRNSWIVVSINSNFYEIKLSKGIGNIGVIPISEQDDWELVPKKFDISTLVPFETKVLVRDVSHHEWEGAIFGRYDGKKFFTIGGLDWGCCIPYEGNEHLFGTTNECDEYYKNW